MEERPREDDVVVGPNVEREETHPISDSCNKSLYFILNVAHSLANQIDSYFAKNAQWYTKRHHITLKKGAHFPNCNRSLIAELSGSHLKEEDREAHEDQGDDVRY